MHQVDFESTTPIEETNTKNVTHFRLSALNCKSDGIFNRISYDIHTVYYKSEMSHNSNYKFIYIRTYSTFMINGTYVKCSVFHLSIVIILYPPRAVANQILSLIQFTVKIDNV